MTDSKERPIIFSGPMVKAILEGRKTQTRRVLRQQPSYDWSPASYGEVHGYDRHGMLTVDKVLGWGPCSDDGEEAYASPYGQVGSRLWVRESFWIMPVSLKDTMVVYRVGAKDSDLTWMNSIGGRWRPSIHMPREASRITLAVLGVTVQRLQDISTQDCEAMLTVPSNSLGVRAYQSFRDFWTNTHRRPGHSWQDNPWTWVVNVKAITP